MNNELPILESGVSSLAVICILIVGAVLWNISISGDKDD